MKIAHLCVSNFYIDGYSYQENELIAEHVRQGHEVLVIASTENIGEQGRLIYEQPREYVGQEGARIVRLPYRRLLPHKAMRKLRAHPGIFDLLEEFEPDTILFHSLCGWELLTVARYKRSHPDVLLYADSHEDWNNSARSFVSREILHKLYYGPILRRALPQIEKILCISLETMDFVHDVYHVRRDHLEFFPLAGHPMQEPHYTNTRAKARVELECEDHNIIFVQSGKQTRRKKLLESLRAFAATPDPDFRLFILGVLADDIKQEAERLIAADERVKFLGWKTAKELNEILAGADIYLQPGTQSVTMQNSLCAHCAVIIDDVKSHEPFMDANGWLTNTDQSLQDIFADVAARKSELSDMQAASYKIAQTMLDYAVLAKRVLK